MFVKWLKPIDQWHPDTCDEYLSSLRSAIRSTVAPADWSLISHPSPSTIPEYHAYVEKPRDRFVEEFDLHQVADEVTIDEYHNEMLVLSFPARDIHRYPYYYRGVQFKPYQPMG